VNLVSLVSSCERVKPGGGQCDPEREREEFGWNEGVCGMPSTTIILV
jgi:hypothetical protein